MIVASARAIIEALNGTWRGKKGSSMVRCPAHKDGTPSLSVGETNDGRPLVHCHANCTQLEVIAALRLMALWPDAPVAADPSMPTRITTKPDGLDLEGRTRRAKADDLWRSRLPIEKSLAESYLRARAITGRLPDCLGFLPATPYWYTREGSSRPISLGDFPAMIAALTLSFGTVAAVQLTYLDREKPIKAIIIAPDTGEVLRAKKTRGPMEDSMVRLGAVRDTLGIAEGIETALSAHVMFRIPTWACLGAKRLGKVVLPDNIKRIIIFSDNGVVGLREAHAAARHYELDNITTIVRPPDEPHGDHNDWLIANGGRA